MNPPLTRRELLAGAGGIAAALPLLTLTACADDRRDAAVVLRGRALGTTYRVRIRPPAAGIDASRLHREVGAVLRRIDAQLSIWRPDSELARFNADPGRGWFPVSGETARVVGAALAAHARSAGTFDPTLGPLATLWGLGPDGGVGRVPSALERRAVQTRVGADGIAVRHAPPALRKRDERTLDLGAIGQGYAIDELARLLDGSGLPHYLIELGGELRARGRPTVARPWQVALEHPLRQPHGTWGVVRLEGAAISTSGVYARGFDVGETRYGHVLDPRTGAPVAHGLVAVSVVAATAVEADAMATALLVMGPDAGLRFAEEHQLAALLLEAADGGLRPWQTHAFGVLVCEGGPA